MRKEKRMKWYLHCNLIKLLSENVTLTEVLYVKLPIQVREPGKSKLGRAIEKVEASLYCRQLLDPLQLTVGDILRTYVLTPHADPLSILLQPSGCTVPISDLIPVDTHTLPIECDLAAITTCEDIKGVVHTELVTIKLSLHEAHLRFFLLDTDNLR